MPSESKSQHNLMEAVAHNSTFAKKVKIPTKVGKDFTTADKDIGKFKNGGKVNKPMRPTNTKPKNTKPRGRG